MGRHAGGPLVALTGISLVTRDDTQTMSPGSFLDEVLARVRPSARVSQKVGHYFL